MKQKLSKIFVYGYIFHALEISLGASNIYIYVLTQKALCVFPFPRDFLLFVFKGTMHPSFLTSAGDTWGPCPLIFASGPFLVLQYKTPAYQVSSYAKFQCSFYQEPPFLAISNWRMGSSLTS